MLDNVGNMILMAGLLVGAFGMPAEFVLTRMIPGTAVGVLVGDLVYTALAFRLARRSGRSDVTAMPLGARHAEHLRHGLPRPRAGLPGGDRARARAGGGGAARLVRGDRHAPGLGPVQARLRPGQRPGPPHRPPRRAARLAHRDPRW